MRGHLARRQFLLVVEGALQQEDERKRRKRLMEMDYEAHLPMYQRVRDTVWLRLTRLLCTVRFAQVRPVVSAGEGLSCSFCFLLVEDAGSRLSCKPKPIGCSLVLSLFADH